MNAQSLRQLEPQGARLAADGACDVQAAKERLRELTHSAQRIEALMERKQRYRELATRATPHYRGVPGGGVRMVSSVEEYALRAVDLEREIDKRLERYARLACEIEAQIDRVDDARLRDLLRWRYLNGWAWERVAEAMHYERRQVFRLHNRALRAFAAAALGEGARWP